MIRTGVLGTANIAERRMVPALVHHPAFKFVGAAIANREETNPNLAQEAFLPRWEHRLERAKIFRNLFGGDTTEGFVNMLQRKDLDAVYIPLPPALHHRWILEALRNGKHVIAEKPIAVALRQAEEIIEEAKKRNLAVVENYGFCYHAQTEFIQKTIAEGRIGELRLIRAAFCFPHRAEDDFRYNKALGGGALLDCGGYTLKAASLFLGGDTEVVTSHLETTPGHEVDIFGTATVRNTKGQTAQLSWGMDNAYQCELEINGSKGLIKATRIFTAPAGFEAPVTIQIGREKEEYKFSDDQFEKLIDEFTRCVSDAVYRNSVYREILHQSALVENTRQKS